MSTPTEARTWTSADLEAMPETQDGTRYEIVDGELIVTPSPTPPHQLVSYRLARQVGDHVDHHRLGQLYFAPVDVVLGDHTVVPDLFCVARDRLHIVGPKAIEGAPDLVIEILSPSTRTRDLGRKLELYAQFGVREYWIADLRARRLAIYVLRENRLEESVQGGGLARSAVLPGLAIDVAALFAAAAV